MIAQENDQLCNDIQDLITENRNLVLENERFANVVHSQQHKIQELEEELEGILHAQDDLLNHEGKRLDIEFKLKFKVNEAVLEQAQLLSAVHRLEEERDDLSEKIKILLEENRKIRKLPTTCMVGNLSDDHTAMESTVTKHSTDEESPRTTKRFSYTNLPLFHRLAPRLRQLDTDEHKRPKDIIKKPLTQEAPLPFRNHRTKSENDMNDENKQNSLLDWFQRDKCLRKAKSSGILLNPNHAIGNSEKCLDFPKVHNISDDDNDLSYAFYDLSSQDSSSGESRPNNYDNDVQAEGGLLMDFGCETFTNASSAFEELSISGGKWTEKY
jgi:regulator of replication initiation timing